MHYLDLDDCQCVALPFLPVHYILQYIYITVVLLTASAYHSQVLPVRARHFQLLPVRNIYVDVPYLGLDDCQAEEGNSPESVKYLKQVEQILYNIF